MCSGLSMMGSLLMAVSPTLSINIIGQVIIGMSIGVAALTIPIYVSEFRFMFLRFHPLKSEGGWPSWLNSQSCLQEVSESKPV